MEKEKINIAEFLKNCPKNMELDYTNDISTISQILKWIMEEKNIYVGVFYVPEIENGEGNFYYPMIQHIGSFKPAISTNGNDTFDSYEEAAICGIRYVFNNLI